MIDVEAEKRRAAAAAVELVRPGMRLGLGTGRTVAYFIAALGARVAQGLKVACVPTSERTRFAAAEFAIPLGALDELPELDLTVDGADEFDSKLRVIKGGGGALLREKIVAAASHRMIVIADSSKAVKTLGKFPLPVEVNIFGLEATRRLIVREAKACGCTGAIALRKTPNGGIFVSEGGHYIVDCSFGAIAAPEELAERLVAIPGVVEHGLFIGLARAVICGNAEGVAVFGSPD
jgi:ribose 5-phosphate isomerase A